MTAHLSVAGGVAGGLSVSYHWLAPAVKMAAMASGNWPLSAHPDSARWTCFPKIATRTLGADGRSVRFCRDYTVAILRRWGVAERSDDVTVVVSELLTNALRHAWPGAGRERPASPVRFGLLQPGRCVICAVADPSPKPPVPGEPGFFGETGRGLQVVRALSDTWGYTPPDDTGKVVWALFCAQRLRDALPCPWAAKLGARLPGSPRTGLALLAWSSRTPGPRASEEPVSAAVHPAARAAAFHWMPSGRLPVPRAPP